MAAPRILTTRRRRPMRVERQTSRRQPGRSAVLSAARRSSALGLSVRELSILGLAVLSLSVTGLAAPSRAAQGLTPLGGSIVSPAPAFPIRAAGGPVSLKSRRPQAAVAASQQRQPPARSPAVFPKSAVYGAAGPLTSGSLAAMPPASVRPAVGRTPTVAKGLVRTGAVGGATGAALRRSPALRPKVRH